MKNTSTRKPKKRLYKNKKSKTAQDRDNIKFLESQYDKINLGDLKTFKDFPLTQKTLKGIKENNYIIPTEIQKQSLGLALQGKDILGAAKTGSGKTLAFLIPILERLYCLKWTRLDGVGALVISPTRELAYQIYETLRKIGSYHDFSAGLIIGGQNLKFERKRMDQINILICTPGRLLQHMDENPLFNCDNLKILILDEADRCLDIGFETTMNAIVENLPKERQTLLFSATQTKSVKDLARLSLSYPTYIAPHENSETSTPTSLQQSYIVCNIDEKIGILWSFIKNHLKQKVLVFMSTCKQVKFVNELFCKLRPGISLLALYGTLHQEKREQIYHDFCRKSNVVLFATDLASRGLDFPHVNWVIQFDCPEDVDTYIHRAGRTARGVFGKGEGLLMLLPSEEAIVNDLKQSKIPIKKIAVDPTKVIAPQKKIEALLSEYYDLKQTAQRAFVNYIKSITLMKNKNVFNIHEIDTDAFARSLGLVVPPRIKFLFKLTKKQNTNEIQHSELAASDVVEKLQTLQNEMSDESDNEFIDKNEMKEIKKKDRIKEKSEKKVNKPEKLEFRSDGEGSDEDFLTIKEKQIEISEADNEINNEPAKTKKKKPLTKAAIAKKLLKKKIKANTKLLFNDDGKIIIDEKSTLKSDLAKEYQNEDAGGIDIEKAKIILKEEDKYDKLRFKEKIKAKHKEIKRKLKEKDSKVEGEKDEFGSNSESDGPDLSWLPDPDKLYNGATNESESQSEEESDPEPIHRPKRKLETSSGIPQDTSKPNKIFKLNDITSSLSVTEAESLAMQLLNK